MMVSLKRNPLMVIPILVEKTLTIVLSTTLSRNSNERTRKTSLVTSVHCEDCEQPVRRQSEPCHHPLKLRLKLIHCLRGLICTHPSPKRGLKNCAVICSRTQCDLLKKLWLTQNCRSLKSTMLCWLVGQLESLR